MSDRVGVNHRDLTLISQIMRDIASTIQNYFQQGVCQHRAGFLKKIINSQILLRLTGRDPIP